MRKINVSVLLIIAVAFIMRFWNLGVVPPSPNWDEAALGYNAYSIWQTGRDEYGKVLPLSLRSYDDYKPPLYMYLTVPSVAMFGLNVWAVRLPAAVMGILAVVATYYMVKVALVYARLLQRYHVLPFVSALFLAISPWHLQFSRMAFEAGIAVTLTITAVYFLFRGLKDGRFLSFSAATFALSLYAYHSQRIFAPLLVCLFGIIFFKDLVKQWKSTLIAIVVGFIVIAPLIPVFTDASTLTRLKGTSALADQTKLLERSVIKLQRNEQTGNFIGNVLDNRRVVFLQTITSGYLSHFSLGWLFVRGDNARHHAPGMGLLYLFELPLLFIGFYHLVKYGKRFGIFLFSWMLIAPIAASPTTELPHAIRTLVFLPTFQILIATGMVYIISLIQRIKHPLRYIFLLLGLIGIVLNIAYYLVMYHVHQNREFSRYWQYGYKEAVAYASDQYEQYEKIVVSTKLEQPHMFFLFYLQYDPKRYLAEGGTASGGFEEMKNKFGKYEFRPIHWNTEIRDGKTLYIGLPNEIAEANLKTIYYLNGEEAMYISR